MNLYHDLINKKEKLAVVGLGYVGLPIALEFARKISVVGFDINAKRVEMMKNRIDPSEELAPEEFDGCDIHFTASPDELREARFFIVAVPTPIDEHNRLFLPAAAWGRCSKKEIMWCLNPPYIQVVPKKIAFLFWKKFRV